MVLWSTSNPNILNMIIETHKASLICKTHDRMLPKKLSVGSYTENLTIVTRLRCYQGCQGFKICFLDLSFTYKHGVGDKIVSCPLTKVLTLQSALGRWLGVHKWLGTLLES